MDDKQLIERLRSLADRIIEDDVPATYVYVVETAAARLTALAEELELARKFTSGVCDRHIGITQDECPVCQRDKLAEQNERLRQLLGSANDMLECGEWKDVENAWIALHVREQIAALKVVPR